MEFAHPVAEIRQNGELLYEVHLSHDSNIELNGNIIEVKDGKIGVVAADCPDKICMKTGFINGVVPIICLPNRVEIRIVNE